MLKEQGHLNGCDISVLQPMECYFEGLVPHLDSVNKAADKYLLNVFLQLRFLKATHLDSGFIDQQIESRIE